MYGVGCVQTTVGKEKSEIEMVKCDRCRVALPLVDYSEKKISSVSFYPPNSEDNRER
jgi:hypothetical protein